MQFTIDARELKSMLDKVSPVLKASKYTEEIKIQVTNGVVFISATGLSQYLEVRSTTATDTKDGTCFILTGSLKVFNKMDGFITVKYCELDCSTISISIKSKNRIVTIPAFISKDKVLFSTDKTESLILSAGSSWLLNTLSDLAICFKNGSRGVYNINIKDKRLEVVGSFIAGIKTLNSSDIKLAGTDLFDNISLQKSCLEAFKKLLNKKSDSIVSLYYDGESVKVVGTDFTYIMKHKEEGYPSISSLLDSNFIYSFSVNKKDILSVMQYICSVDTSKYPSPVVLHSNDGVLYSFSKIRECEVFDKIDSTSNTMNNDLFVYFDPKYLSDIFDIIDTDNVVCRGISHKSPLCISGKDYTFMLAPMGSSNGSAYVKCINNYIKKAGECDYA